MPIRLINGVAKFRESVYPQKKALFEKLAEGQWPHSVFVTCSDSRIDPYLLTSAEPGDLFVIRTAGNIIPPQGVPANGVSATMEYAVSVLKVRDIVVCGHARCGAMDALTRPEIMKDFDEIRGWIEQSGTSSADLKLAQACATDVERIECAAKANVAVQLHHLTTYDFVKRAMADDNLILMGWYYDFVTGRVESYDPANDSWDELQAPKA